MFCLIKGVKTVLFMCRLFFMCIAKQCSCILWQGKAKMSLAKQSKAKHDIDAEPDDDDDYNDDDDDGDGDELATSY